MNVPKKGLMAAQFALLVLASFLRSIPTASAHEVRPAFLEVRQSGKTSYDISWKRPALGTAVIRISPRFPDDCREVSRRSYSDNASLTTQATIVCTTSLAGRRLFVDGLEGTMVDVLVRTDLDGAPVQSLLLRRGNDSFTVAAPVGRLGVLRAYLHLGVEHILLGVDHLLFVFGLLLAVPRRRSLFIAITTFTLAHSVTLALASLGVLKVPGPPVEAVIALSIVLLAAELMRQQETGEEGLSLRRPWMVSFAVGLLHGLGFAGALAEVGLPRSEIPTALISFNIGVELGQIAFVASLLAVFWLLVRLRLRVPEWLPRITTYALGGVGTFWVFERTLSFL